MRGHLILSKLPETYKASKLESGFQLRQSDLRVLTPNYYTMLQNPQQYCKKTPMAGPPEYLRREIQGIQEKDVSLKKTREEAVCHEG